jgi:carbamoyl-phosphate synthase large subunit
MPRGATGTSADDVRNAVEKIGFPVLIRPSYVLGGRGMEILANEKQLEAYLSEAYLAPDKPLLVDEYLGHAIELDVDAAADGEQSTHRCNNGASRRSRNTFWRFNLFHTYSEH